MTHTKKLRDEWREEIKRYPQMDSLGSADWWIEKIAQAIAEERERVRGEIEKLRKTKTTGFLNVIWGEKLRSKIPAMSNTDVSYNQAIDDILSSLDTNHKE